MNPSSDEEIPEKKFNVDEEGEESDSDSVMSWLGLSPQNTMPNVVPNPEPEHVRNAKWNARIVKRLRKSARNSTRKINLTPRNDDAKSEWSFGRGRPRGDE